MTFPNATLASTTNITAGTITTVTNLTNAPTSGDLTATMKTSVTTACTASTPTAAAVTGAVGSVTARVTANTDQWAGGTIPAPTVTGVPLIDLKYILGTILTETSGQIAAAFKKFFNIATPASTMDHLVLIDTATTATNLTNAPTSGDFTATMKSSLNSATPASITGAVGSVTGNVGGNVAGSVASVTAAVTVGTINASASNIKKNTAINGYMFVMTSSTTHSPQTGLTVSGTVSHDGGAFGPTTNSATEIGNGWYTINLSATDLNGNNVALASPPRRQMTVTFPFRRSRDYLPLWPVRCPPQSATSHRRRFCAVRLVSPRFHFCPAPAYTGWQDTRSRRRYPHSTSREDNPRFVTTLPKDHHVYNCNANSH